VLSVPLRGESLTGRFFALDRLDMTEGLRNREIADRLCITEGTVKVHLHNVYKLQVENRVAVRRYAEAKGLV
jgi:DNA-binding NarL/FixJ family response regulator